MHWVKAPILRSRSREKHYESAIKPQHVPSYFAIVIITLGTGVQAHDAWFPLTVIFTIQSIAMNFIYSKQ